MPHYRIFRALFGAAGLAGCITLIASQARADTAAVPALPEKPITITARSGVVPPNFFDTVTLPARAEKYVIGWQRARIDASSSPLMQQLIAPVRGLSKLQQMNYVQAAVSKRIIWRTDATEWGTHDYWASARETLERGAGDAEDRAILKMQALRALGVPTNDMYLTIGKLRIGGPPITVLLVRLGTSVYLLDDWSGPPIPAERKLDFEPIMSFSGNSSWLHGRRYVHSARNAASRR